MKNLRKARILSGFLKSKIPINFDVLKHRELTFSDEFDKEKLDAKKMAYQLLLGRKTS